MNYADMSTDGLVALVAELKDLIRQKRGEPSKTAIQQVLDRFRSDDFLGTGLSAEEYHAWELIKRYQQAYAQQERPEQSRRLDLVIRLSGEYQRVRTQTVQSSAFGRRAIECVLSGDWKRLEIERDLLTFTGESPEMIARYRPIWNEFVSIIDEALRTAPATEPKEEPAVRS